MHFFVRAFLRLLSGKILKNLERKTGGKNEENYPGGRLVWNFFLPKNVCWVWCSGKTLFFQGRDARNLLFWTVPPTKEVPIKHDVAVYGRSKSETRLGTVGQQLIGEASRGRTPRQALKINDQVKKPESKDIRARYWSYLFENLRRAIDKDSFQRDT